MNHARQGGDSNEKNYKTGNRIEIRQNEDLRAHTKHKAANDGAGRYEESAFGEMNQLWSARSAGTWSPPC